MPKLRWSQVPYGPDSTEANKKGSVWRGFLTPSQRDSKGENDQAKVLSYDPAGGPTEVLVVVYEQPQNRLTCCTACLFVCLLVCLFFTDPTP